MQCEQGDSIVRNCFRLGSILLSFFLFGGCIQTMHYFEATEELRTDNGTISFFIDDIDYILRGLRDHSADPRYQDWIRRVSGRYGGVVYDPSYRYWVVQLIYWPHPGQHYDCLELTPDAISIDFTDAYRVDASQLLEPVSYAEGGQAARYLSIEPIPIPHSYQGDFTVHFDLTVQDSCAGGTIEKLPVTVKCVHTTKKWTPLFPGEP